MGLLPFSGEKVRSYSVGCINTVLLTKYYLDDPILRDEMDRACDMYGGNV